jgi:hypothetical protein
LLKTFIQKPGQKEKAVGLTVPGRRKIDVIFTLVTNPPSGGFVITGMYQIVIIIYRHEEFEPSILKPKENL